MEESASQILKNASLVIFRAVLSRLEVRLHTFRPLAELFNLLVSKVKEKILFLRACFNTRNMKESIREISKRIAFEKLYFIDARDLTHNNPLLHMSKRNRAKSTAENHRNQEKSPLSLIHTQIRTARPYHLRIQFERARASCGLRAPKRLGLLARR